MTDLAKYWIKEIAETREFKLLSSIEGGQIDIFKDTIQQLIDDQFIHTARESGISRREEMLGIHPYADDTLEDRRFRVLSRWNSSLPYTYTTLLRILDTLCGKGGYTVELNHGEYTLRVMVELTAKRMEQEVRDRVRKMAPANLIVTVELRYRQHWGLKPYTHGQLSKYTHAQLREDDLR